VIGSKRAQWSKWTAVALIGCCGALLAARPGGAAPTKSPADDARKPYEEKIPNTVIKFQMVPIPAGTILVKDPAGKKPPQNVHIKPFYIGKMEVTWDEFDVFLFRLDLTEDERKAGVDAKSRPSKPYGAPDRGFGHAGYPALGISYYAVQEYCKWLSAKTGKKYRLPTTAEWEYACRAGENKSFPMADEDLDKIAWYWENGDDKAHAVGEKAANAWGLHDMLGNVAEWCTDADGTGWILGGSFVDKRVEISPAYRKKNSLEWNATDPQNPKSKWWLKDGPFIGFRVVCEG
jgi:formylglycine-generating enzyme required for sulfatase activity